ncbi:uncharacterized protein TNCV_4081941 [Trichonephila clavipes]|nr:uncharacterized protein TNCV_4081941 [Trichonephila clavipes]
MGRKLHLPGNVDNLARQLEQIWQEIPQKTIRELYHSMPRHVVACIQARGYVNVQQLGVSTSDLTTIYPPCTRKKTVDYKQPTSYSNSEILIPSLSAITIYPLSNSLRPFTFPLTRKSRCKNDSLPSREAVKYHSLLITWLSPVIQTNLLKKCGGV